MKILLHSNGPTVGSGYGVQTALLARRLKASGHDVAISAYCGQEYTTGLWEGITVYPRGFDAVGNDILHLHAQHHFGGDRLGGWIIPLTDMWALTSPLLREFNIAAWTPIDHFPVPLGVREFFTRSGATPIAMSRWGEDQLRQVGHDPLYAPLAVDTNVYKPTESLDINGQKVTARQLCGLEPEQFVVMMCGMNKGAAILRKGWDDAFLAFADLAKRHPEAVLYLHTEQLGGAGGINLIDLLIHAGVPEHQVIWTEQYAYRLGMPAEYLAAAYTAADVLLAPSRGEGFCVPLIEAQACGTPVIVTDFSAQPELVGAGWKVPGQPLWDPAQTSWYIKADIPAIVRALDDALERRGDDTQRDAAIEKAAEYDADKVFEEHWTKVLAHLEGGAPVPLDRPRMPDKDAVAVIVPALDRPGNVDPLVKSFKATAGKQANLYFVCDADDEAQIRAVKEAGAGLLVSTRGSTFAQKVNSGYEQTTEPWLFVTGDDVRFHRGWIAAAREKSGEYDVIGTSDHPDGKGNPRVASGAHADHFFIRRAYVETYGGCLDGLVCHEGYQHFYSDVETVELAKARRVFTPCLASVVEHLHPDLGKADLDDTYRKGWGARERDEAEWRKRAPLVAMQREAA